MHRHLYDSLLLAVVVAAFGGCSSNSAPPGPAGSLDKAVGAAGDACIASGDCAKGLTCTGSETDQRCGTCRVPADVVVLEDGARCDVDPRCNKGKACACAASSECAGQEWRCTPIPAPGTVAAGSPCGSDADCAAPNRCPLPYNGVGGVCAGLTEGAKCTGVADPCAIGLVCSGTKCARLLPDGAPCVAGGRSGAGGGECVNNCITTDPNAAGGPGTCKPPREKGAECGAMHVSYTCAVGLGCSFGGGNVGSCTPIARVGEPCGDGIVCASANVPAAPVECSEGTCRRKVDRCASGH